jgi:hypothetical protein
MVNVGSVETSTPPGISSLPEGSVQQELFQLREDIKKVSDRTTRLNMKPLSALHKELDQLTMDELDEVKKIVEATQTQNAWGYNRFLITITTAAASIIGGMFLIGQESSEGWKYIGTGSVALGNALMEYHGTWTEFSKLVSFGNETVEYSASLLPYAVSVLNMGYAAYNLASVPLKQHEWMDWISSVLSTIDITLRVGTIYTNTKKGLADARLMDIRGRTTIATKKIEPITRRNEALGAKSNAFASQTKRTLQNYNKVNSAAMAQ